MPYNSESIRAGDLKLRVLLPINCQKQNARSFSCQRLKKPVKSGSLSTRVFDTPTATGREHFTCQDSGVSQIFVLIICTGEKILSNVNVVV